MGSPLVQEDFIKLLEKNLDKVFTDQYKALPAMRDRLFKVENNKSAWLQYFSVGSVPDPERFHGTTQYQSVSPGFWSKIEGLEYAGGITIERLLIDTDQYGVINSRAKGLATAMKRKQDKIAHEPFIHHDSTAFTFMSSEHGEALCANSHASKSGLLTDGNDNLTTLPFNAVNLEAVWVMSRGLKDDIGERFDTNFDTIVHGTNLTEAVYEVINSQGKVDEMTNNANWHQRRWKSIELPLLDDYDTDDWMLVDSSMMKEALIWHNAVPTETNMTVDFDTHMAKYNSYARVGWGWTDWRWIIGSSVS